MKKKNRNLLVYLLATAITLSVLVGPMASVAANDSYTVVFDTKIDDVIVPLQQVLAGGLVVEPPTPIAPNERLWKPHVFEGWYKDTFFQEKWDFATDTVTENTIIHAKWLEVPTNPNTITYVLDTANGVVGTAPTPTVSTGPGLYPPVKDIEEGTYHTNPDMEFVGWSMTPDRRLEFKPGDTYRSDVEGVVLYDVWRLKKTDADFSNTVNINWDKTYQTIRGFGGSTAYHKAAGFMQMGQVSEELGTQMMNMYFDPDVGMGLEVVRLIIGDGGIRDPNTGAIYGNYFYDGSSDSIWPEKDGGYVWDQPDWETKKADFDKDQIWFAKKAMEINPDVKFVTGTWSPPYWMKANQSVTNHLPPDYTSRDQGSGYEIRLLYEYYDEWADYLVQYCLGMYREFGIPIYGLSATNECEKYHDYPTYVIRGTDYENFLLNYLKPALEAAKPEFAAMGIDPPIIMAPDASRVERSANEIDLGTNDRPGYGRMMAKKEMQDFVGIFNTHFYANNLARYEPKIADGSDPWYPEWLNEYELWETEIYQEYTLYSASSPYPRAAALSNSNNMPAALYWARVIANAFASEPGFSVFTWWWPVAVGGDMVSMQTLWSGANTTANGSTPTGTFTSGRKYYTFCNFSRFVRPGYVRVGADQFPALDMNVTAYKDPETGEFAIVAINEDTRPKTITFTFDGADNLPANVAPYRTSVNESLRLLDTIPVTGNSFVAVIPASSVTTFVPDKGYEINVKKEGERALNTTASGDEYNEASATGVVKNGDGSITLSAGGYIKFNKVNFNDGSYSGSRMRAISMRANAVPVAGGTIDIRVDDPETGKIVGRFDMRQAAETGVYTAGLDVGDLGAYGIRDLYLVARGGAGDLMTITDFSFNGTAIDRGANLLTNGNMDAATVGWIVTDGGTAARQNSRAYRSYALTVSDRTVPGSGIESNALHLTAGQTYAVNAQILSPTPDRIITVKDYDYGNGKPRTELEAKIELVYYQGTHMAAAQTIAFRDALNPATWSELDGTFVYQPPKDAVFDSVKLKISTSDKETFMVDDAFLTEALPEITVSAVDTLVAGYAANVPVTLTGSDSTGLKAQLFGKTLDIADGKAAFKFTVSEVPAAGTYNIEILDGDTIVATKAIYIVDPPVGLWTPIAHAGTAEIVFAAPVSFSEAKKSAKIDGAAVAIESVADTVVTLGKTFLPGQTIILAGVKYAELFPSYSFTFTINTVSAPA